MQEKINHKPENEEEAPRVLLPEEALALVKVQEERLRRIQALGLGFWIFLMICGGVVYHTFPVMLGLFLGGGIVVLNFFWLTRLIRRAFQEKKKPPKSFFFKFGLKFFLLLAIVAFVIYFTPVNPIAFLAGLSVSVFGIMADGLIGVFKKAR
ncbi:MAG: hypothetical protein DSY91_01625 [Deltaproteobacteria bacterium]|nr:MAG: hypothetical protein DSY91_01625 [Deltaproteobacteria bacterium]